MLEGGLDCASVIWRYSLSTLPVHKVVCNFFKKTWFNDLMQVKCKLKFHYGTSNFQHAHKINISQNCILVLTSSWSKYFWKIFSNIINSQINLFFIHMNSYVVHILNSLCIGSSLTHLFPMHPFSTTWKHQKILWFSDVFKG